MNEPRLILADEPTGELDSGTTRQILDLFRRLVAESGMTVVVATHNPLVGEYAALSIPLRDGMLGHITFGAGRNWGNAPLYWYRVGAGGPERMGGD